MRTLCCAWRRVGRECCDGSGGGQTTHKVGGPVGLVDVAVMMAMAVGSCRSRDAECGSRWLLGSC